MMRSALLSSMRCMVLPTCSPSFQGAAAVVSSRHFTSLGTTCCSPSRHDANAAASASTAPAAAARAAAAASSGASRREEEEEGSNEWDAMEHLLMQIDYADVSSNTMTAGLKLMIGRVGDGRGLFGRDEILKGEIFLQIGQQNVLSPSSLPPALLPLLHPSLSDWAKLALLLLIIRHACSEHKRMFSNWQHYVACLPPPHKLNSTIFWPSSLLPLLPPSLLHDTQQRQHLIAHEFDLLLPVFKSLSYMRPFSSSDLQDQFRASYALVCSRAWSIEALGNLALVPFADMLNHDPLCSSLLCYDEEQQLLELVADRNYSKGQEVVVSYGDLSNGVLALDYGFSLPANCHDTLELCLLLPASCPLLPLKLAMLSHHSLLPHPHASGACFTLSPAGSSQSTGKGVPHALRAFARVAAAGSEQQLQWLQEEAERNHGRLGRRPVRRGDWEARAMLFLLEAVDGMLQDQVAAVKASQAVLGESNDETTRQRLLIGRTVLESQLSLLRSVASWLRPRSLGGGLEGLMRSSEGRRG